MRYDHDALALANESKRRTDQLPDDHQQRRKRRIACAG